jgi:hypothetical protein
MQFELNPEEVAVLDHALSTYVSDLKAEIIRTDRYDMRQDLKHDRQVASTLLASLKAQVA